MEYCPGGDLSNFIVCKHNWSEDVVAHFFAQVMQGIAYLHEHSLAHRDIKPDNIFFDSTLTVKIGGKFGNSLFL